MTSSGSQSSFQQLGSRFRLNRAGILVPALAAGALLFLGTQRASADTYYGGLQQYSVAGQTVTVNGSGYTASADPMGVHVAVQSGSGSAKVNVDSTEVDMAPGDAITVGADNVQGITSMTISVSSGYPDMWDVDSQVVAGGNDTPTTLTPGSKISVGTPQDGPQGQDALFPDTVGGAGD